MEVRELSGWQCAARCLDAMGDATDFETRRSLWRAASRYAAKDRTDRLLERGSTIRPHARPFGGEDRQAHFGEG